MKAHDWDIGRSDVDTLIEVLSFEVSNEIFLRLKLRITRDGEDVRIVNLEIENNSPRFSDSLVIAKRYIARI
jgi:hypothetical protein